MKKIPYGLSDFVEIRQENFYYVDKTDYIRVLENLGRYLFLVRPRRMGKSLLLSVLDAYYDIDKKDKFEHIFSGTKIYQGPTEERSSYFTLSLNFSLINPQPDHLEESFENYTNTELNRFLRRYKNYFNADLCREVKKLNRFADKLNCLFAHLKDQKDAKLYILIDEYDNFTNTILSAQGRDPYISLTHGEGFLRYFFNILKGGTTGNSAPIKRLFITGVSPVTMDDVTSGFNIGEQISLHAQVAGILGFTEAETRDILAYYLEQPKESHYDTVSSWYNNYRFSKKETTSVFNSDMVLYYTKSIIQNSLEDYIDENVKTDYKKLKHLTLLNDNLTGNFNILREVLDNGHITADVNKSFPVDKLVDPNNFVSLLYYLGLLSIGKAKQGEQYLKIPNETVKRLYYEYIRSAYEDVGIFNLDILKFNRLMAGMAYRGEWRNVFSYLVEEMKKWTKIRDYIRGEKVVQTFLLAYLNIADYFLVHSEYESNKGFADLYCEPFFAKYPDIPYAYLIEVKYLSSARDSKKQRERVISKAEEQLSKYADDSLLKASSRNVKLKKITVLFVGCEIAYAAEVS